MSWLGRLRVLNRPSVFLIGAQVCWGLLMFVWIRWYVMSKQKLETLVKGFDVPFSDTVILIEGCVLMGLILVGLYFIYVAFRRQVRLNRLQKALLDSVTHEFKTPLASIRLFTETMLMRELSHEDLTRFLGRTLDEVDRLQRITDGMLASARIRSGARTEELTLLNPVPLVRECWQRLAERAGSRRKLELSLPVGPDDLRIRGHAQQLSVLFDNLFENALKYSLDGGRISLRITADAGTVRFEVQDDGQGIEKKELKRIFSRFYRAEGDLTRIAGSGLGLFVASTIVRTHNGKIGAESAGKDQGALFYVTLPRACAPD